MARQATMARPSAVLWKRSQKPSARGQPCPRSRELWAPRKRLGALLLFVSMKKGRLSSDGRVSPDRAESLLGRDAR